MSERKKTDTLEDAIKMLVRVTSRLEKSGVGIAFTMQPYEVKKKPNPLKDKDDP